MRHRRPLQMAGQDGSGVARLLAGAQPNPRLRFGAIALFVKTLICPNHAPAYDSRRHRRCRRGLRGGDGGDADAVAGAGGHAPAGAGRCSAAAADQPHVRHRHAGADRAHRHRERWKRSTAAKLAASATSRLGRFVSNGEIQWTVKRGSLVSRRAAARRSRSSTPLTGTVHATGQISGQAAGGLAGALGDILGQSGGRGGEKLGGRTLDQRADMRGNVAVTARPSLTPAWRIEPNLSAKVIGHRCRAAICAACGSISPARCSRCSIARSMSASRSWRRGCATMPLLEQAVRREWTKLCRSQPVGRRARRAAGAVAGDPPQARHRCAAAHRRGCRDAPDRRRGRGPHRAAADASRTARSRPRWRSCRRPTRAASPSRCRSTCRSPRSIG